MCGTPDGVFVTLFHTSRKEPLEKIETAFFNRKWADLNPDSFKSLSVSRFLAAKVASLVAKKAFSQLGLDHHTNTRLVGGVAPLLASENNLWIGYRFFSEAAHEWARLSAGKASNLVCLYFADTKYQFKTDLPQEAKVMSIAQLDATTLGGQNDDFIRTLMRGLELPTSTHTPDELKAIVAGELTAPTVEVTAADVHEALAALKCPCRSKSTLRYQLASALVLNAWIESERKLGFKQRKKFYAFKKQVGELAAWAASERLPGVDIWVEDQQNGATPLVYIRIDDVDFSFHAVPNSAALSSLGTKGLEWKGVRMKAIAPYVLEWARGLRQ